MSDYQNEPAYTRGYSNDTVCNYFYYLSIIVLSLGVFSAIIHSWGLFTMKNKGVLFTSLIVSLIPEKRTPIPLLIFKFLIRLAANILPAIVC